MQTHTLSHSYSHPPTHTHTYTHPHLLTHSLIFSHIHIRINNLFSYKEEARPSLTAKPLALVPSQTAGSLSAFLAQSLGQDPSKKKKIVMPPPGAYSWSKEREREHVYVCMWMLVYVFLIICCVCPWIVYKRRRKREKSMEPIVWRVFQPPSYYNHVPRGKNNSHLIQYMQ